MEEWLRMFASTTALGLELVVVLTVLIGAVETALRLVVRFVRGGGAAWSRRQTWMGFARWIVLALEFALGADIIRTAIAPTWDDIGKLAAIAAVRTGLGFFLERDIGEMGEAPEAERG